MHVDDGKTTRGTQKDAKGKKTTSQERLRKSHGDEDANGCVQAVEALHWGRVQRFPGAKSSSEDESLCFLRIYSSYSSHCDLAGRTGWQRGLAVEQLFHHVPSFLCGCSCCVHFCFGNILSHYSLQVIDASKSVDSSGRKCHGCSGLESRWRWVWAVFFWICWALGIGNVCSGWFFQHTKALPHQAWVFGFFCFSHHQEIGILVTLRYILYPLVVLRHALPLGCQSSLRYFAYGPQTANLAEVFMSMMVAQLVSVKTGEWHKIWKPKPLNLGQSNCACVAISQGLKQVSEMKV